jgi:hypothetical protein
VATPGVTLSDNFDILFKVMFYLTANLIEIISMAIKRVLITNE